MEVGGMDRAHAARSNQGDTHGSFCELCRGCRRRLGRHGWGDPDPFASGHGARQIVRARPTREFAPVTGCTVAGGRRACKGARESGWGFGLPAADAVECVEVPIERGQLVTMPLAPRRDYGVGKAEPRMFLPEIEGAKIDGLVVTGEGQVWQVNEISHPVDHIA